MYVHMTRDGERKHISLSPGYSIEVVIILVSFSI